MNRASVALVAVLVMVTSGCQTASTFQAAGTPTPPPSQVPSLASESPALAVDLGVATVSADTCSFEPGRPITVAAAEVTLEVRNNTEFWAAFDLWRIDDDRTFEDLVAHVEAERAAAEDGAPGLGHPGFLSGQISSRILQAGESKLVTGRVRPGTWALVCLSHFDAVTDDPFRPSAVLGPIIVDPT